MTWTYAGAPGVTSAAARRDAVREEIGDVDEDRPQLTDEVIAHRLTLEGVESADTTCEWNQIIGAAIRCCRVLMAKYARDVNIGGGMNQSGAERYTHYRDLMAELRREFASHCSGPYLGGQTKSRRRTLDEDTDLVQPAFQRGMHDNPGTDYDPNLWSED